MEYPYELRPKWYWQRPSDRVRRMIERISKGRALCGQPLQDLAYRIARRMTSAVTVVAHAACPYSSAVANGKWASLSSEWFVCGFKYVPLRIETPTGTCRWCGTQLFNINHSRCNSRLCRELSAVAGRYHQTIRIRLSHHGDHETRELAKAKFISTFYLRKLKEKQNATRLS